MNSITHSFGSLYHPKKAFVIYQQQGNPTANKVYIESYDISADGTPVNAHPLSMGESAALAKALQTTEDKKGSFLKPKGLLPKNVLYIHSGKNAYAVWETPAQQVRLLFSPGLGIGCGTAHIPPLIWKASKERLGIYAVKSAVVDEETPLFHAPFFNVFKDGRVCMGNVRLAIPKNCCLDEFISLWQNAFFNSYFSHMMNGHNPVNGNMVQLWKTLTDTGKPFPLKSLIPNKATLKQLIK